MRSYKFGKLKKLGTYVIELFIVVLGVSIAFQLNVWNDQRKETLTKAHLLENFISEDNINQAEIDSSLSRFDASVQTGLAVMELVKDRSSNLDSIRGLLAKLYQISWPDLNTTHLDNYLSYTSAASPLREELLVMKGGYIALDDLIKTYIEQKQSKYFDYLSDAVDMTDNLVIVDESYIFDVKFRNYLMILTAYETSMSEVLGEISRSHNKIDSLLIAQK